MNAILGQIKANLRSHGLQVALVTVTLVAAASLLTMAFSTFQTAQGAFDRLFERTNGAHLWLYLEPEVIKEEAVHQMLRDLPELEANTQVMPSLTADLFVNGERLRNEELREWPDLNASVGRSVLVAGRAPLPGESDVIVLDRNMAAYEDIHIGDAIDVLTPSGRVPLLVIGLVVGAEMCPYGNCFPLPHFLPPGELSKLGLLSTDQKNNGRLVVGLRLKDPGHLKTVLQEVQARLPEGALKDWIDWETARRGADYSVQLKRIFLLTFGIVSALAAGFLIANIISESLRSEVRQIGLLKAVGVTGSQLTWIYLLEYLGLALVASVIGLLSGSLISRTTLRSLAEKFGETLLYPPMWIILVVPLSVVVLTALFSLLPVWRASQISVVRAIQFGSESPKRRVTRLLHLPVPLSLGISETFSRPFRSFLLALGMGLATFTLISASIVNATMREMLADPGLGARTDGDMILTRSNHLSDAESRCLIAGQTGVAAWYAYRWFTFQFPGEDEMYNAILREGDLDYFKFPLVEGRMLNKSGEAVVGYGLSSERNLHTGDMITVLLSGQPAKMEVVGVYREVNNGGRMMILPLEDLRHIQAQTEAFGYVLKLYAGAEAKKIGASLTSLSNDQLAVHIISDAETPQELSSLVKLMAVFSLVLIVIAAVGMFTTTWVSMRERQRELALFKAVGLTPRQVSVVVYVGVGLATLAGYLVGLPTGIYGVGFLVDTLSRQMGFGPLKAMIHGWEAVGVLPVILLVAIIGAWFPAYRAGKINVIELLRYE